MVLTTPSRGCESQPAHPVGRHGPWRQRGPGAHSADMTMRTGLGVGLAVTTGAGLLACSAALPEGGPRAQTAPRAAEAVVIPRPAGSPRVVRRNLDVPWSIAFAGRAALIAERDTGRVVQLRGRAGRHVVGRVPGIRHGGEGGLLGLATRGTRWLYAYSTAAGGNRIQRFPLRRSAEGLALGRPRTILAGLPAASFHNGGRIAFGPDGMLYAGTGDAGVPSRAQDPGSLGGKLLRMTPLGGVPRDNPFPGSLVYSSGHRNVQGLAWTRRGAMYATEFGQNTRDELNRIRPGANYGWPRVEGRARDPRFRDPVRQWHPADASPSGLAIVRGTAFIANLRGESLRAVRLTHPRRQVVHYRGQFGRIRAVTVAPNGRLWFTTNNTDGRGDPRQGDDRLLSLRLR